MFTLPFALPKLRSVAQTPPRLTQNNSFFTIEAPYFTKEFKPVEVLKEYDVMLLAEVAGTPPFEITWFKDNTTLRSGRKCKTFVQDQLVSLQVLKFVAADAGEYQCRVSNDVGSSTCSARVTLRG